MLLGLKISNIAVIEEVEVSFAPGLTVLTGETGAGKSILIDSLGLLLGARASADVVRAGCDEASVEAVFAKTPALAARLASMGLPDLSDEVSLRRVIGRTARKGLRQWRAGHGGCARSGPARAGGYQRSARVRVGL